MEKIYNSIDANKDLIIDVSHQLHQNPELGFEEYKSVETLIQVLKDHGFEIERNIGGLETAFKASKGNGKDTVAFLAEYDALPEIGHACGHNVIAAASLGAAIGLSKIIDNMDATIEFIGTPAEESGGGKIILMNEGVFDHVDFAMMVHPSSTNLVGRGGTALVQLNVEFHGKNAHSSAPESGINALKALINTFNGIDAMSQEFPLGINVNGIIHEGGKASNIIPDYARGEFLIRGLRLMDLKAVKEKFINVIKAAEVLTGAKATYAFELPYAERYPNKVMGGYFKESMEALGETVHYPQKGKKLGSSDIGNVSLMVPTIHPYVKIGDDLVGHTVDFTEASGSSQADEILIKASKAMASLAYKIISDENFKEQIREEFELEVPDYSDFEF